MAYNANQMYQPTYPAGPYANNGMAYPVGQPMTNNQSSSFVWVQGEAGAKAYPVAAGNRVALFDSENPVVYLKATDAYGKPQDMEVYDLVKRQVVEEVKEPLKEFLTKDEIGKLVKAEVDKAISEISLKPTSKKKKKEDDE